MGGRAYRPRQRKARPWVTVLYVAVALWWLLYGALDHELFSLLLGVGYAILAGLFLREQLRRREEARFFAGTIVTGPPPPPPRPGAARPLPRPRGS